MKLPMCILWCLMFSSPLLAQLGRPIASPPVEPPAVAGMSHEQAIVLTAYAKLAFAAEEEPLTQLALAVGATEGPGTPVPRSSANEERQMAAAQLRFTVTDFKVGNYGDVAGRKLFDLISLPTGERLASSSHMYSYAERGRALMWYTAVPHWQPVPQLTPEMVDTKLGEFLGRNWPPDKSQVTWLRYAQYSVTVTFKGKSRGPYQAMFVFGRDASGEVVVPEDATTDSTALAEVLWQHLFPDGFTRGRMRTYPVVQEWLARRQMTCSVEKGDLCCDLAQLQCGPPASAVADALRDPIDPIPGPKEDK